ncbi:MAG: PIN domain-containing protein [Solirubrobacterales bacterium]|nr:PIN domain-containing protein [Solirubrobacterales bacterium]
MAVLIDTAPLIALERGESLERFEVLLGERKRAISVITASELLHGVHRASPDHAARRRAFVEHILAAMDPLPLTATIARVHAQIWADVEAAGTPVGAHDLWIAATAVAHGLAVVTANLRDFSRVRGLEIIDSRR